MSFDYVSDQALCDCGVGAYAVDTCHDRTPILFGVPLMVVVTIQGVSGRRQTLECNHEQQVQFAGLPGRKPYFVACEILPQIVQEVFGKGKGSMPYLTG